MLNQYLENLIDINWYLTNSENQFYKILVVLVKYILVCKTVSQISFKLFCLGDKRLLSEFLWKWGWFQGHNECFPKYLG